MGYMEWGPPEVLGKLDFSGKRILLVDDNSLNRELLSGILAFTKVEIDEAENGQEAVERIKASSEGYYALILMDIRMPILDGYGAARAIRALDRVDAKTIPIIAMTANVFTEDIIAAKNAGMNEHLGKPIDFNKMGEIFKKWLGNEASDTTEADVF